VHPRRPCRNRRQLGFQPVAFPGGLRGRGGGFTSCRTGGAGSPRTADGPSSSATSVSSPTGRRLPQRVNTASPPSSASTSPTISHPMRPPHPPRVPPAPAAAATAPDLQASTRPLIPPGPSPTVNHSAVNWARCIAPSPGSGKARPSAKPRLPHGLRAGEATGPGTTRAAHATTSLPRRKPPGVNRSRRDSRLGSPPSWAGHRDVPLDPLALRVSG